MSDRVVLNNWRRFPRARLSCEVVYGDRFQSWRSHTRDISLGGCRVAGYYPFPLGKPLALKITHPAIPESVAVVGKVARLYGGAENAVGLVFDVDAREKAKFESWMRKVVATDPSAERTISRMPAHLPIEARLTRAPRPALERTLSNGEISVVRRLEQSHRAVPLLELRTEWGGDWERKAQVLFDLIADGIVLCSLPPQRTMSSTKVQDFAVDNFFKTSGKLMKDLETEYGPLDKGFARELEAITQEVIGTATSAGAARPKAGSSSTSGDEDPMRISWVASRQR